MISDHQLIIPDLDVWLRACDRQQPDPRTVHALSQRIAKRQIVLLGWLRQGLLARAADERQAARLRIVLAGFPNIPSYESDQAAAAALIRRLRAVGIGCTAWQARVWALADRVQAVVWSQDRYWQPLTTQGCPVRPTV